jgi:hypothetical protein
MTAERLRGGWRTHGHFVVVAVLFLRILCTATGAHAATSDRPPPKWLTRNYLSLGWSAATQLGSGFERSDGISTVGATVSIHFRLNRQLSLGLEPHWQLFDAESGDETHVPSYDSAPRTMSWKERRFFTIAASGRYYMIKRDTLLPYIGLGIGAMAVREKYGITVDDTQAQIWHFMLAPELGMHLLHGRIPFWLSGTLHSGFRTASHAGEIQLILTIGVTVPH